MAEQSAAILLPRHVLSDGGAGRGLEGATPATHQHDWWLLAEGEVDRPLIHAGASASDSSD